MLIECKNVCLAYENHTVVSGLSFSVSSGDYVCVIGENGSGKTTLMKTLLGLKTASSGSIVFGEGLKANDIGYMPQQNGVQKSFPASVWEIVLSGRINKSGFKLFYTKKDKNEATKSMERLGISALKNACFRELSGGQQQRVLLARAVCAAGRLLLLDEPAAGLDELASEELYSLILEMNKKHGIAVIMVTHDVNRALKDATHILHLHKDETFFGDKESYAQCAVCSHKGHSDVSRAAEHLTHSEQDMCACCHGNIKEKQGGGI